VLKLTAVLKMFFNGVALDITQAEADKLKQSPYVKAVYPDLEVKTNLMGFSSPDRRRSGLERRQRC